MRANTLGTVHSRRRQLPATTVRRSAARSGAETRTTGTDQRLGGDRPVDPVERRSRTCRVQLPIEGSGLYGLLLLTRQFREAGGEGVGDAEVRSRPPARSGDPDPASLRSLPVIARHDPAHELVEQRHGERGVAVARTPDHALGDELASCRAERGDISP